MNNTEAEYLLDDILRGETPKGYTSYISITGEIVILDLSGENESIHYKIERTQ